MKRFILFIAFFGYVLANAQNFEGVITYQISYPTVSDKAFLAGKPTLMTVYVKGNKIKSVIESQIIPDNTKINPTPVTQAKVVDLDTKSYFELLSVGKDAKYVIETTSKQVEEIILKMPESKLEIQDSTKMIKGYLCKIAILTIKYQNILTQQNEEMPLVVYYSEAMGNKNLYIDTYFHNINGLMLEYTILANQIPIKFTATKIKKKKIKDTEFVRPEEGYQQNVDKVAVQWLLNGRGK